MKYRYGSKVVDNRIVRLNDDHYYVKLFILEIPAVPGRKGAAAADPQT